MSSRPKSRLMVVAKGPLFDILKMSQLLFTLSPSSSFMAEVFQVSKAVRSRTRSDSERTAWIPEASAVGTGS